MLEEEICKGTASLEEPELCLQISPCSSLVPWQRHEDLALMICTLFRVLCCVATLPIFIEKEEGLFVPLVPLTIGENALPDALGHSHQQHFSGLIGAVAVKPP
jgi:hypothetical protein